jgi:hypothetical protein
MRTHIKPAFQIQRINELENRLNQLNALSLEQLTRRPNAKSWSAIEVMKHMVLGHNAYQSKIDAALALKPTTSEIPSEFRASAIPSFLIKRFPPKEGKIKFKMKTSKMFKPVMDVEQLSHSQIKTVLTELQDSLEELKTWVKAYRTMPVTNKKFNSAIGATVRFSIPEACEFILCHNERHFLQLERAIVS